MQPVKNSEPLTENVRASRRVIMSMKHRAAIKRTFIQKCADWLADSFGTVTFFIINAACFLAWIILNSSVAGEGRAFDPFPFNFLTMAVSLEAIFLSIIVLISQNRSAKIDDLRQELDLQLNLIEEQEVTKIMEMLAKIMEKNGIDTSGDAVLAQMLKPTNTQKIEETLEKQM